MPTGILHIVARRLWQCVYSNRKTLSAFERSPAIFPLIPVVRNLSVQSSPRRGVYAEIRRERARTYRVTKK